MGDIRTFVGLGGNWPFKNRKKTSRYKSYYESLWTFIFFRPFYKGQKLFLNCSQMYITYVCICTVCMNGKVMVVLDILLFRIIDEYWIINAKCKPGNGET